MSIIDLDKKILPNQSLTVAQGKVFVVAVIAISITVWNITFDLGVFKTVFFEYGAMVWVASTVAFLTSLFVQPTNDVPLLTWRGRMAMLLPTAWLLFILIRGPGAQDQPAVGLAFWVTVGVLLIALPNLFSVVIMLLAPGLLDLRQRRRWLYIFAGIVIVIGLLGYVMGVYNELLLTCYDFQVSGNDLPRRCKTPE